MRVIEERPLSMEIQDTLGVKHASPQAILVKNGRAEWNASHWKITEKGAGGQCPLTLHQTAICRMITLM